MVKRASAGKNRSDVGEHLLPEWAYSGDAAQSEDQQDLFYAHIDNENFDAAKKQVDDLIKESPYLRRIYGSPTPQPNDNWLLGQSLLTQYHIAANELPEAEKLAEHLARTGSGNQ